MTENAAPQALAAQFPMPDHGDWMKLVEKALKGGDFERRMVSRSSDGLRMEPLYTRRDALPGADSARPGSGQYVRGLSPAPALRGWSIEQIVAADSVESANAAVLAELEGGATGVVLRLEAAGQVGIPIADAAAMARVLEGVYLEFAPLVLDAGPAAPMAAKHLIAAARRMNAPVERLPLRFDIDPIGHLARTGHAVGTLHMTVADAVDQAIELRAEAACARTILADGRVAHEAGASEAQELAVMAASTIAYLRAFEAAGTGVSDAIAQMTFALAADADLFLTVAKLRAARRVLARICEACGAPEAVRGARFAVTTSARMMTRRDPWTNMLRTTAATAGAAFGGADAITVLPFTWAIGKPDHFAARIARNTQIVAQEESSLGRVTDPAGGSWYVEQLTDKVARRGWELLQGIERDGGILATIAAGSLQRQIAQTAAERGQAIATGRQQLTGTSAFPKLGDDGIRVEPWPAPPALSGEPVASPLAPHRLAEPFEELRDAADAAAARSGKPPTVFLASIGTIADHTARTTWVKNQLAVGGIATIVGDGFKDADEAADAFRQSGAHTACICSSDDLYRAHAVAVAKALVEAGAERVLLAGRPGDLEAPLRAAGVDRFLYAGQNAIEVLTELQLAMTG